MAECVYFTRCATPPRKLRRREEGVRWWGDACGTERPVVGRCNEPKARFSFVVWNSLATPPRELHRHEEGVQWWGDACGTERTPAVFSIVYPFGTRTQLIEPEYECVNSYMTYCVAHW